MIKPVVFFLIALSVTIGNSVAASQDPVQKGQQIMKAVDDRDKGETLLRKMDITITDKNGNARKRLMTGGKKYYSGHAKSRNRFSYPDDIKGTTLLTYDYDAIEKDDDQWIYLPAIKKTRRIPASQSSSYFMGTDFTFEDMKEDLQFQKFNYRWLKDEKLKGRVYHVIESLPVNKSIEKELGYSKILDWIHPDKLLAAKTVYYDLRGERFKELDADIVKVDGIYTYSRIKMHNTKRNTHTVFKFKDIRINKKVSDKMFRRSNLER